MKTKIFQSGNSQAVPIPKEFEFEETEVEIFKRGDEVILKPRPGNIEEAFALLAHLSDDFMADGRDDAYPQEREIF